MQLQKGRAAQEPGLHASGQQAFVAILAIQQRQLVWVRGPTVHGPQAPGITGLMSIN